LKKQLDPRPANRFLSITNKKTIGEGGDCERCSA
jgi:hypothetical protein